MKSKTMTQYQIHMTDAKAVYDDQGNLTVQIPVTLQLTEWCSGLGYLPLDGETDEYFIIVNYKCAAVYHTAVSPLEDESGYDNQAILYSLRDHDKYIFDSGREWFVGYIFNGPWARVLNKAVKLYEAYSCPYGFMED